MGRLMLNVLLSFAQFEREVTGERIRDKIAASILAFPSADFGPVDLPPWNWHFRVLLIFNAGLRHCSRVRFDIAEHLRQVILPPAVTRYFSGYFIAQVYAS